MKKISIKNVQYTLLLSVLILFLSGCGSDKTNDDRLVVEIDSIEIVASKEHILSIETMQFNATATYDDASTRDITPHVTWSSSNISIATVNTSGLLTPRGPGGDFNVTTGYGGFYHKMPLKIIPLVEISMSAPEGNLSVNSIYQMNAMGRFYADGEDNVSEDITSRVLWSTSDTNISAIDGFGLMYTFNAGTVEANATLFGINDMLELNITE